MGTLVYPLQPINAWRQNLVTFYLPERRCCRKSPPRMSGTKIPDLPWCTNSGISARSNPAIRCGSTSDTGVMVWSCGRPHG